MAHQQDIDRDWQDLPPIGPTVDLDEETPPVKQSSQTISIIKDHIDLHSAMYHQHLVAANRSILCIKPSCISLNLQKLSESSSSKSRVRPISGTGTVTVVTKTTTTTTISGFPIVDGATRESDLPVTQEPSFTNPNSISSDDSISIGDSGSDVDSSYSSTSSTSTSTHEYSGSDTASGINEPSSSITKKPTLFPKPAAASKLTTPTKSRVHQKKAIAKKKRTSTSYDPNTTAFLKKIFFNCYSKQYKLTKKQRELVMNVTGLRSRNVTYWFSNHKRRLGTELQIYRKAAREYGIKNYDEFIQWRKNHDLPEDITREEIKRFKSNQ